MSEIDARLSKIQGRALRIGSVAFVLLIISGMAGPQRAMQSWLLGFLGMCAIGLGSLGLLCLHNLTGGGWGHAIRRVLEAATKTLPILAVFALPLLLWPQGLYEWAHPEVVAADPILQHKAPYLNTGFFRIRTVVYFAIWIGMAALLRSMGSVFERAPSDANGRRLRTISGPGLAVFGLTLTFASFDWGMSLEPHWFSTMYGVIFIVGSVLSTLCFSILVASWLARCEPVSRYFQPGQFHDLGNLLLAFVMLWAYVGFSQYLIIWSANLSEEAPWYIHRLGHGWQGLALFLLLFHFAVPFLLLLSRKTKRRHAVLAGVASVLLVLRFADLTWLVVPAFERTNPILGLILDVLAIAAAGGLWLGAFLSALRSGPLHSVAPPGPAEAQPASQT